MKLEGLKINFLGDSITEGAGTSGKDKIFHALLKEECGLLEARNYGIGGTRIARQQGSDWREWNERWDENSFCERFDKMDDDADVVVVFGGTNDFGHGDAPIGGFTDRTPDTFYGACHFLFRGLSKKYIGKPIVIMTPLHRVNEKKNTGTAKGAVYAPLKTYVEIIREVAEYYSLPVLDLYKVSGIQQSIPEVKKALIPDGLHPNDRGYDVMFDYIIKDLHLD